MPELWQRMSSEPLQDDPVNAGLLDRRRTLLESDDDDGEEDEEDNDKEDEHDESNTDLEDMEESKSEQLAEEDEDENEDEDGESGRPEDVAEVDGTVEALSSKVRGGDSAHAEEGSDDEEDKEDGSELRRHHKHHHKKHKHKKHKHKKDGQQCRYLEGLSRSVVKFGTSSGDYLAVSHGNNTCYQAVSSLSRSAKSCMLRLMV